VKQKKKVTGKRPKGRKVGDLKASADAGDSGLDFIAELGSLRKPRKKLVRLHLDADVLAWFRASGRGYQTRINRALRRVIQEEQSGR
jgi:uncharacterized protein (DUF4415 family)